jgi:zinc/manganese transport system substrate-binding protein
MTMHHRLLESSSLYRLAAAVFATLALFASPFAHAEEKLAVVASFSILGDLVQQVGGDRVQVTTLVGPNGDPHVYQPTPQDGRSLASAKLLIINGLGFEGWIDRLVQVSNYRGARVVASTGVALRNLPGSSRPDPHAWQDPTRVHRYVANIEAGLAAVDPAHATEYHQRAAAYQAQLAELEHWAETTVATVPAAKRRVITSHDAFGYLGERFGLSMMAAQGLSTESEPSAKDIGLLIQQMRQQRVRALFVENISNPRLLEQIARETGATPGAELFSDALSKRPGPAPDYLSLMRHNIAALVGGMKQN